MSIKSLIKNKYFKITVKLIITIACFYILYLKTDVKIIRTILKEINFIFLILATLCFIFSKYISALRLKHFFELIHLPISQYLNLKLYLLGMYYNLFLPGGLGGDAYKAYYLRRKYSAVSLRKILTSLIFDRLNGLFVLLVLVLILFFFVPYEIIYKKEIIIIGVFLFPLCLYILMYLFFKESLPKFFSLFIYSIGVQLIQLLSVLFIILSLNIHTTIYELLFVFLISTITVMIPITIGGSILRELTFVYFSVFLHYDKNYSITIALLFYLITAFVSLFGIYYSLYPKKIEH